MPNSSWSMCSINAVLEDIWQLFNTDKHEILSKMFLEFKEGIWKIKKTQKHQNLGKKDFTVLIKSKRSSSGMRNEEDSLNLSWRQQWLLFMCYCLWTSYNSVLCNHCLTETPSLIRERKSFKVGCISLSNSLLKMVATRNGKLCAFEGHTIYINNISCTLRAVTWIEI